MSLSFPVIINYSFLQSLQLLETEKVMREFALKEHQLRFTSTVSIDSCENPEAFFTKTRKDLEE